MAGSADEEKGGILDKIGDAKTDPEILISKIHFDEILRQLSPEEAYLLNALFGEGQSPKEVANTLHINRNAVDQRKRRLLIKVKKLIERSLNEQR